MTACNELTEPVYFKNRQWAVTGYGMEALPTVLEYWIEVDRLADKEIGACNCYNWPTHMARQSWVDIELFLEAFAKALDVHAGKCGEPPSALILQESAERARQTAIVHRGSVRRL